jgi:hypothetical protein
MRFEFEKYENDLPGFSSISQAILASVQGTTHVEASYASGHSISSLDIQDCEISLSTAIAVQTLRILTPRLSLGFRSTSATNQIFEVIGRRLLAGDFCLTIRYERASDENLLRVN